MAAKFAAPVVMGGLKMSHKLAPHVYRATGSGLGRIATGLASGALGTIGSMMAVKHRKKLGSIVSGQPGRTDYRPTLMDIGRRKPPPSSVQQANAFQKHIKNTKDTANAVRQAEFARINPAIVEFGAMMGGRPSNRRVAANVREATLHSFNGNATKTPSFSAGHREISHRYI